LISEKQMKYETSAWHCADCKLGFVKNRNWKKHMKEVHQK